MNLQKRQHNIFRSWTKTMMVLATGLVCFSGTVPAASALDPGMIFLMSGVRGGLVVHVGCGDGALTEQLRPGDAYYVHGLDTNAFLVESARKRLLAKGVYGPICVDRWDGKALPYADNLVNLLVVEKQEEISEQEMLRVLAPNGVALVRKGSQWQKTVKPWPKEMDEWTHYFHAADGNPVGKDTIVGPPKRLQWVGSPRWSRHHDHAASMNALVSAGGRLYYLLDEGVTASVQLPSRWRLVARDAFNGVVLWKRDIQRWNTHQYPLKSGPAHLLRRLVAVGDEVFVTLGIDAPVTVLDGATGQVKRTFEGSEFTREIVVSEGVAFFVADTSRSLLPDWRRRDTYVWANTRRANPDWGWKGAERRIFAYDARSGKRLWEAAAPVAPCSMAVDGKRVVFQDGEKLVALDRKKGETLWESEPAEVKMPVETNTGPRVLIYEDVVLYAGNNGKMSGWSAADGTKLWEEKKKPSGHQSLKDLFVVQGLVWSAAIAGSGDDGAFTGFDPKTGKVVKEFPADVKVHWFHHRCYPSKATGKYLLTARNGTEFIDLDTQSWKPHHWVRGGCIYGVMPCNGMTYASMHDCGCQMEAKLNGFNALAPGPLPKFTKALLSSKARLEKGPAYKTLIPNPQSPTPNSQDWPTYRHDPSRSGASSSAVAPEGLKQIWQTKLSGRLTAPTIADGKVFVATVDTHTVHALDSTTGNELWSHTTGGRVDSPPTIYKRLVLFGSADGYVYALRAKDGALAWRFRGAPLDRRMMAWEQIESAWPVHGSVLVFDDVIYCTAGRNMFLDGGLRFLRLDAATGELLGETVMDDTDPVSGEDMHLAYLKKTRGNNMPVAHSDVLSFDGKNIWMRSQKITCEGERLEIGLENVNVQPNEDFHIFCQNGFLDDTFFFRSYWTYGRRVTGGYGGWLKAGNLIPSGRILCFDEDRVYGFGRKPEYMTNSSVLEYQVFAADKKVTQEAIARVEKAQRAINSRSDQKNAVSSDWLARYFFPPQDLTATNFKWTMSHPGVIARAMAVAGDTLYIAGPTDYLDERQAYHEPDNPEVQAKLARQAEAFEGKHGGQLWAFAKADGKLTHRYALDTIPVFDGLAVARGGLFMTTVDGRVIRLGGTGAAPLKTIEDRPASIEWEKQEDPNYLKPPVVFKDGDFDKVAGCEVVGSELGYRLQTRENRKIGIAVKRLDQPVTGSATFKTRVKATTDARGLRNGYLAFGNGMTDAKLIKCGVRMKTGSVSIVQGLLKTGKSKTAKIQVPAGGAVDLTVKVDLEAQTIVFTANGVTVEAPIDPPLKSITHVGYAMDSAIVDFSPVKVQTP